MCPAESPARLEADDVDSLSEASNHSRRPWAKGLIYAGRAMKATLCCSYANVLLVFVPLGIISGALGWNSVTIFTFNFLAIFPLAALLSYSTDELSAKVGQIVGGLVNASFGNAVEMIVSCPCIIL
jgi:Ca2+:H+ antiporter